MKQIENNSNKREFLRYVELLSPEEDRPLLQVVTGIHRSVLHKYVSDSTSSQVTKIPQSAINLVKLLVLIKKRSPELYTEWATLMQVSPETFDKALSDQNLYEKIQELGVLKYGMETLYKSRDR